MDPMQGWIDDINAAVTCHPEMNVAVAGLVKSINGLNRQVQSISDNLDFNIEKLHMLEARVSMLEPKIDLSPMARKIGGLVVGLSTTAEHVNGLASDMERVQKLLTTTIVNHGSRMRKLEMLGEEWASVGVHDPWSAPWASVGTDVAQPCDSAKSLGHDHAGAGHKGGRRKGYGHEGPCAAAETPGDAGDGHAGYMFMEVPNTIPAEQHGGRQHAEEGRTESELNGGMLHGGRQSSLGFLHS